MKKINKQKNQRKQKQTKKKASEALSFFRKFGNTRERENCFITRLIMRTK